MPSPLFDILLPLAVFSLLCYQLTSRFLPPCCEILKRRGIYGIDINKITTEELNRLRKLRDVRSTAFLLQQVSFAPRLIPESAGLITGCFCIVTIILCALFFSIPLRELHAALCSLSLTLLLGFVDDVLDVRWRYKLILSILSTVPLVTSYSGSTTLLLPIPMRGGLIANILGFFFHMPSHESVTLDGSIFWF